MAQQIIGDLVYNLKINKADSIKVLMDLSSVLSQTTKAAEQFGKNLEQATTKTTKGMKMLRQEMSGVATTMGKLKGTSESVTKSVTDGGQKAQGIWKMVADAFGLISKSSGGVASTGGAMGRMAAQLAGASGAFASLEGGIMAVVSAAPQIAVIAVVLGGVIAAVLAFKTAIELAVKGISFLITKTIEFGKNSIQAYGQLQTAQIAYNSLLGENVDMTNELIAGITKLAVVSPSFNITEGLDIGKRMMAMGTPPEELVHTMEMLGNMAAATGAPLDRIALVFGQIRAAGKIMGNDWMQLKDAGIPIFELIGDAIGKSADEVMRMKEEGEELSFEAVAAAFERATGPGGRFNDMLLKLGLQTIPGLISLFKEFGVVIQHTFGELISGPVLESLQMAGFAVKTLADTIIDNRKEIVSSLGFIAEPIKKIGDQFSDGVGKAVAWIVVYKDELLGMAQITWDILSLIGNSIINLASAFGNAIFGIINFLFGFSDTTLTTSQKVRIALLQIEKSIYVLMGSFRAFFGYIQVFGALILDGFSLIASGIGEVLLGIDGALVASGNSWGISFQNVLNNMLSTAGAFGAKLFDSLFGGITGSVIRFTLGEIFDETLQITSAKGSAGFGVGGKSVSYQSVTSQLGNYFKSIGENSSHTSDAIRGLGNDLIDYSQKISEVDQQINQIGLEDQEAKRNQFRIYWRKLQNDFKNIFSDDTELPPVLGGDGTGGEEDGGGGGGASKEAEKRAKALESSLEKIAKRLEGFFEKAATSVEKFYDWYDKTFGIGLNGTNNLMTPVENAFGNLNIVLDNSIAKFDDYKKVSEEVRNSTNKLEEDTKKLDAAYDLFDKSIADSEDAFKDFDEAVAGVQEEYDDILESQTKYNEKIEELTGGKSPLTKAQVAIGNFVTALEQGNLSTSDLFDIWDSSFDNISDALEQLADEHDEMFGEIDDGVKTVIESYEEAKEALEDWHDVTGDLVTDAVDIIMDAHEEIDDLMQDLLGTDDLEKQQEILAKIRAQESIISSGSQFKSVSGFSEGLARAEEWAKLNPLDRLKAEFEFQNQIRLEEINAETKRRQAEVDELQKSIDEGHRIYQENRDFITNIEQQVTSMMGNELVARESLVRASLEKIKNMYDQLAAKAVGSFGFAGGGYTGSGDPMGVAGTVHNNEYVVPSRVLNSNPGLISVLEKMRLGGKTYHQTINNYNSVNDGADAVLLSNSLAWRLRT